MQRGDPASAAASGDARLHARVAATTWAASTTSAASWSSRCACHARGVVDPAKREKDEVGAAQSHKNLGITHLPARRDGHAPGAISRGAGRSIAKVADRRGEAVTLRHLGNLHYERGDTCRVPAGTGKRSLSLCRELGESAGPRAASNNLGYLHFERSHYASCERLFRESLEATVAMGAKSPARDAAQQSGRAGPEPRSALPGRG